MYSLEVYVLYMCMYRFLYDLRECLNSYHPSPRREAMGGWDLGAAGQAALRADPRDTGNSSGRLFLFAGCGLQNNLL